MEDQLHTGYLQTGKTSQNFVLTSNEESLLDKSNNTTKQTYRYSRFMDNPNLTKMNDTNNHNNTTMGDKSFGNQFQNQESPDCNLDNFVDMLDAVDENENDKESEASGGDASRVYSLNEPTAFSSSPRK